MLQEVSGMTDIAEPAWTFGIVGDIWDQMLTLSYPTDLQALEARMSPAPDSA